MRRLLAPALLALVAACSNGQFNPIVDAAVDEILPGERAPEQAKPKTPVTRAALTRADVAAIRVGLLDHPSRTLLFAASENGGYVTYSSVLRQNFTLNGAFITGVRGVGWDLLSAASSRPDPLVSPIPPGRWPASVKRTYIFPNFTPQGRVEVYDCRFEMGAVQEMVIVEQRHRGVLVTETCTGDYGSFENLHFADVGSGQVWRSLQWVGPQQGIIDLEILVPFTGRRS
ncbi:YjbF family lipoprotein [Amaricoccus sp.]|uniref:YjbF family lipoprotein n=1 Tax=Amaricoccus sp. TaxID=1872485 RepID=UPI001B61702D|nr:YjbF family lipoprotein [Amaricoccus sp.]MBP7000615.1 YjbF family lipoprotein [Amaricoccus sp.]